MSGTDLGTIAVIVLNKAGHPPPEYLQSGSRDEHSDINIMI